MTTPRVTTETLPLGGDYLISSYEVEALNDYLNDHDAKQPLRIWRGTSGTLYLLLGKGALHPLSPEQ